MSEKTSYQILDPVRIVDTVSTLSDRIDERFPDSGLHRVSQKLLEIGRRAEAQAIWISKPIVGLRVGIGLLIFLILLALAGTLGSLGSSGKKVHLLEFVQVFESGINDVVLIAVAVFFLGTLEKRFKRHRALKAIHELRAIAHIIDMHQLTKDPIRYHWEAKGLIAPRNKLSPLLLTRYLDYCSEMLSLVGKISVLYVQQFDDPVALTAVNEVEHLTTGLSRKIWQKLMVIQGDSSHQGS